MTNKDNVLTAKKSEATKRILKDNESETKSGENLEPSSKIQKLDRGEKDRGLEKLKARSKKEVRHRTKDIRSSSVILTLTRTVFQGGDRRKWTRIC